MSITHRVEHECDVCERLASDIEPSWLHLEITESVGGRGSSVDLCPACAKKLLEAIHPAPRYGGLAASN